MKQLDCLGWAVKSGDDVLVRELLGRQTAELTFDIETAAQQAIDLGRLDLFDLLVGDNPKWIEKLVTRHNHDKCGDACFIPHLLQRIPSDGHSEDVLFRLIKTAISLNDHTAAQRWLEQWTTSHSNGHRYLEEIASMMIKHHLVEEFFALRKKYLLDFPDSQIAGLLAQYDCVEIWTRMWGNNPDQDHMRKALNTCREHQSVNILEAIWDHIEFEKDDFDLHTFLKIVCNKKHVQTINWLLNKTNRSDELTLLLMRYLLEANRVQAASELFEQMSDPLRLQAFDPHGDIFKLYTPWREHFEELMEIQSHEMDCQQRAHDQKLLSIQKFEIFSQWGAAGNIDKIRWWCPFMDPKQQRQALMAAAEHGHLDVVQFLMEQGHPDDWACPFLMAAKFGHLHIVEFFLNTDLEQQLIDMAMNKATNFRHSHVAERLYPLISSQCQQQVLSRAVCFGGMQTIKFLIEQGCTLKQDCLDWMMAIDCSNFNKNDQIIPQIAHLLPTHPYNAVIFERCVQEGMLQSAQVLLSKFDHHSFSFHNIFSQMCQKGDLRMVRFLAPHYDFNNRLIDSIGLAIEQSHWVIVEDMLEHCSDTNLSEDLLWTVFTTRKIEQHIAIHMAKKIMQHCTTKNITQHLLHEVACRNIPAFVDLIYPLCTLAELRHQIQWVMLDDEVGHRWETLHLTKRYEEDLLRFEMEQATSGLGAEPKTRIM